MYNLDILKRRVIEECKECGGSGMIGDIECKCRRKYRVLVSMLMNDFPEELVYKLEREELPKEFDIRSGKEFFEYAFDKYKDFLEKGLSLVFYGEGSLEIACYLSFLILFKDYLVDIGFSSADKELSVLVYGSREDLLRILEARKRGMLSTFLCLSSLEILERDFDLSDFLGFDGESFAGSEIWRGVECYRKEVLSRWE